MSRLATSFVLGFHGCDEETGRKAVNGEVELIHSDEDYDWLGPGAYFWESDPLRAWEWAQAKCDQGKYSSPFAIGAVIDLRNCLDLSVRENIELLPFAHEALAAEMAAANLALPKNTDVKSAPGDLAFRRLDCAVIRHLHQTLEEQPPEGLPGLGRIERFDTVRGSLHEGGEAYKGAGFYKKTHTQIAVRTPDCIKGLFLTKRPG